MDLAEALARIGLEPAKSQEIQKNKAVAAALGAIAAEADYAEKPTLLHHLALASRTATPEQAARRVMVSRGIAEGSLASTLQVDAAWKYVQSTQTPEVAEMNAEAGVGVTVTEEDVREKIKAYISENKAEIEKKRYSCIGQTLGAVKRIPELKWAAPAFFKPILDSEFLATLGPKDERDAKVKAPKAKAAPKGAAGAPAAGGAAAGAATPSMFKEGFLASIYRPDLNPQQNENPGLWKEHLEATKGQVFTRFPPEPNGFLHIGHAKAIAVDFGFAAYHGGQCYLRFDDTNPEAEDDRFAKSIQELVEWLGFKPFKITWSSDYFDQLYELAEVLIKNDGAYVCFCTAEQVKRHRGIKEDGSKGGERTPCPDRGRSPLENLELFRAMREGKYAKGEATLRMKQDLANPNPQMWDLVAYRVMDAPHHRTGTKWKIYPTYDFTHCLVDSIENITHSLCTLEFYLSRESYEWLCDAVKVYKPAQREFGRLNLVGSVMSKRKIMQLVEGKHVRGWDDPRLYTLVGLRRRGVSPGAILAFISELGVTTTTSQIEVDRFEGAIRKHLENTVPRLMMVLDPVPVILDNLPEDHHEMISVPFKPGTPEMGEHSVPFTRTVYVDRTDFREEADPNYFRLAPGKSVGLLKVPYTIRVTSFDKDSDGKVTAIHAHYENEGPAKKPKTFIQWVAESPKDNSPIRIGEVREFERLFKSDNPSAHPDGYLADINPNSERIYTNSILDTGFTEVKAKSPWTILGKSKEDEILSGNDKQGAPEAVRFQALRVGYYCMDSDSTADKIVLNRIVTLKEDKGK